MIEVLITIILAAVIAEFMGFWIHRLLHSNKIEFLSKGHMIHHMLLYGPKTQLRSKTYKSPLVNNRFGIFDIGLEWWIPAGLLFAAVILLLGYLQIIWYLQIIFVMVFFVWGFFFYNYMHDAMHLENFWMIKSPHLSKWFLKARELHDIHHLNISDNGKMNKNYGICFFALDKIFGTYENKFHKFNDAGYENAKHRYAYILGLPKN